MNKTLTITEFSKLVGIDYGVGSALIKFLVIKGLAKEVGKIKSETGKGKPSSQFEISNHISLDLF